MWWWIGGYLALGAVLAGLSMGLSKTGDVSQVSLPKFLSFLVLWPILFVFFTVAIVTKTKRTK